MKHSGIAIGIVAIGAGLTTIGLNMNGGGRAAHANAPMVQAGGPTIVWYGVVEGQSYHAGWPTTVVFRAWSDGTIECKGGVIDSYASCTWLEWPNCGWKVVSSPTQGLSGFPDINFDERGRRRFGDAARQLGRCASP